MKRNATTKSKMVNRWSDEDRRAFNEQRLRAKTMPNKKRVQAREACRRRGDWR